MITKTTRACLVAASLGLLPSFVVANELPGHGMSMDEVRKAHGAPDRDMGAVGTPAITRWVYDGFTVYFEGRRVVHTVRTQSLSAAQTPPAAAPAVRPAPVTEAAPAPAAEAPIPRPAPLTPPAPAPAVVVEQPAPAPAVVDVAPIVVPPPAPAASLAPAAPVAAPAPAPAPAASGGFRFDPTTGRLIIDSDQPAAEEPPAPAPAETTAPVAAAAQDAAPAEEQPQVIAPFEEPAATTADETPAAEAGSALDESLEFDPETGTFRPKQ